MKQRLAMVALVCMCLLSGLVGAEGAAGAEAGAGVWTEPAPARPLLERKPLATVAVADYGAGLEASGAKAGSAEVTAAADNGRLVGTWAARSKDQALICYGGAGVDVANCDYLRFDLENMGAVRVNITLQYGEAKPISADLPVDPGVNRVCLPLMSAVGGAGLKHIGALTQVQILLARQGSDAKLAVGPITAVKLFSDLGKVQFFDCGGGAVWPGATALKPNPVNVDAGLGCSLTGENLRGVAHNSTFTLFDDGIAGDHLTVGLEAAGPCEVQAVAWACDWQGVRSKSYSIRANGQQVFAKEVTKENFYTFEGQYYGANLFYDKGRSLFEQYHRKLFEAVKFEAIPAKRSVVLEFEGCGLYALWVYPQALAEEGRAFVDCMYAETAYDLWLKTARMRDHAANPTPAAVAAEATARGYTLFTRYYQDRVYPDYAPSAEEVLSGQALKISAAGGELEPVTFTVRPVKDLGKVTVAWSELKNGEQVLPATVWTPYLIKCQPYQVQGLWYEAVPTVLYPNEDRVLKAGENMQYWATLRVPAGTAAGLYQGTVTITPEQGTATALAVEVRVWPFELPKTATECGMWNNTAFGSHGLGQFEGNALYTAKILDAECKNMADHGLNGYCLGGLRATAFDTQNCKVTLDFAHLDQILAACKANGMTGRHMLDVQGFATYGLMRHGFPEFSAGFNKAYIDGLTQVGDWIRKNDAHVLVQITDEPRETELNEWNRNLHDTVAYCRLARQVPGLQTMVTLMADKGGFGRPYSPILGLIDVLASHSWPKSDDIIYLATERKLCEYWAYNNGFNRFAHGFYLWKVKGLGHWQWVYSWEVCEASVPVHFPHDSSAVYAFPGGFLNTIKYEDVREGIDDHRYLELLQAKLATAVKTEPARAQAEKFLATLNKFLPQYPHDTGLETGAEAGGVYSESKQNLYFNVWRAQMAEYIVALQEKRAAMELPEAWAMFPQTAKEEDRAVVCTLIDKASAPTIDGKGEEAVWGQAKEIGDFVDLAQGRLATVQTQVKTVCDGEQMYFLFTCVEPKYGELKGYAINLDEDTWQDDSVEIFLDTAFDRTTYKHISVNCLGTVQDSDGRDVLWNGVVRTAVAKQKGRWTVEVAVQLAGLGGKGPADGVQWGVNLCRNRQPAPQETSSWAFVGHSFHNPSKFGTLVFKK